MSLCKRENSLRNQINVSERKIYSLKIKYKFQTTSIAERIYNMIWLVKIEDTFSHI